MIVPDFDKDTTLLAVFDGHGGEAHVAFCAYCVSVTTER